MPDSNISNAEQTNSSQTSPNQQALSTKLLTMSKSISQCLDFSWAQYNLQLQSLPKRYQLSASLKLLAEADRLLNQQADLLNSSVTERMLLAGYADLSTQKDYNFDIQNLGGVSGFASFKKLIKSDRTGLNKLMKIIPNTGVVDGWHYLQFIDTYQQWFTDNGYKQAYLLPVTRLLAMKRPDQFIPLNDETCPIICNAFTIKPLKKQDFKRYWDQIISRIHQTEWFKIFQPMDPSQLPFHRGRVAFFERMAIVPVEIIDNADFTTSNESDIQNNEPQVEPTDIKSDNKTNSFIREDISKQPKIKTQQPKKMTIAKLQTVKGNKNSATKLMSQYYFANRDRFAKINIKKHRDTIIERLIQGESVEDIFTSFL